MDIAKGSIAVAAQAEASKETAATIQVKATEEETVAIIQLKATKEETVAIIQVEACNRIGEDSSNHPGGGTRGDSSSH